MNKISLLQIVSRRWSLVNKMNFVLTVLLVLFTTGLFAQTDSTKVIRGTKRGNDTIPLVYLPVIDVFGAIDPAQAENLKKYLKLRRDVLRAYPYAKLASQQL